MTTISGAGEPSAVSAWGAWGKTMIAQSQKAEAEKAAAKAAAEAANPGSTVVKLSDEAKAKAAAHDWYRQADSALLEKGRIEKAQWDHAVSTDGANDPNAMRARFGKANAAEKEAYVQRGLIDFDTNMARVALSRKFTELINRPGGVADRGAGFSEGEIASMREDREFAARHNVVFWSSGPPVPATEATRQGEQGAAPVTWVKDGGRDSQRTYLEQLRQKMGVGTGAATDPAVQRYALPSPGPTSTAEQLVVVQQRIDAAQSEYAAIRETWQKAAERGEKWALPQPHDPTADNTGVNTFRYEESHEAYAPNIVGLSLEVAKWSLAVVESDLRNPAYAGIHFHSRYGDQVISDMKSYVIAANDYISKLESGALPAAAMDAANGTSSTSG